MWRPIGRMSATRWTVVPLVSLVLGSLSPALAQNIYEDLEGRFTLELPEGWELASQQMNMIYQFKGPSAAISMVTYLEGVTDLAGIFQSHVEAITGAGHRAPPAGSVVDMTLNGCPARWAEYTSDVDAGGQRVEMLVYIGDVVDAAGGGAVQYLAMIGPNDRARFADALKHSFETLRLHGRPLTGVADVREVHVETVAAPAVPTTSSVFEHELLSLTLPPGWTAEPMQGDLIAKISHGDYGSLTIMGKERDKFGKDRDEVYIGVRDGAVSSIPSLRTVRASWEIITDAGETLVMEELQGSVTYAGQDLPQGVIIAAAKDSRRGLGFLAMFSATVRDSAVEDIMRILKSLK